MHNADEPLDRDLVSALDTLDYPVPSVSADAIIGRARRRARERRLRVAAAAVVTLTAVAVAAYPASPVRQWLQAIMRPKSSAPATPARTPPGDIPSGPAAEMRGVSTAIGSSAQIAFSDNQSDGEIVLRLVPAPVMRVRAPEFPASYSLRGETLLIRNPGMRTSYDVEVAERAANVSVVVAGRIVFRRQNGVVVTGPRPRSDGAFVLSLTTGGAR